MRTTIDTKVNGKNADARVVLVAHWGALTTTYHWRFECVWVDEERKTYEPDRHSLAYKSVSASDRPLFALAFYVDLLGRAEVERILREAWLSIEPKPDWEGAERFLAGVGEEEQR